MVARKPASAQPPDPPDLPSELESTAIDEEALQDGAGWAGVRVVDAALAGARARAISFTEARVEGADLSGAQLANLRLADCELVGCNLANLGPASLRGVAMPWSDVVAAAATFADALGIEILEE